MVLLIVVNFLGACLTFGALKTVRRYRHEPQQTRLKVWAMTMSVLIAAIAIGGWILSRREVLKALGVG